MSNVVRLPSTIDQGDPHPAEEFLPLVYEELHKLAVRRLAWEKPGLTLQATALVHEAYLRLVANEPSQKWNSRGHFFAAAAEAMRRILVEQARRRKAEKRGGKRQREAFDTSGVVAPAADEQLLAVHDSLDDLDRVDSQAATLVKLRFFGGMTMSEAADALEMSVRSAHDLWAYARSWLRRQLRPD